MWRIVLALSAMLGGCAEAQELSLLAGAMQQSGGKETSYAWAFEYQHPLHENLSASFSWLNEGHVPGHHRDGQSLQLWGRTNVLQRRLSLAAGVGPYRYYDTTASPVAGEYANVHGWGVVGSLAATYYAGGRWLYQLRFNRIVAHDAMHSSALLLGIGYQLAPVAERGPQAAVPRRPGRATADQVTASLGFAILNSDDSERDTARALEYRHGLGRHVDLTLSLLDENSPGSIRRTGVAAQLWGVREALAGDRLVLGVGLGPYLAVDRHRRHGATDGDDRKLSWIFSAMAAYRFGEQWSARASWSRIHTSYHRDTDVLLFGVAYRY